MKKCSLALLAIILMSNAGFAQLGFGLKGGYNISNVKTDSAEYSDITKGSGFNLGLFLQFPIQDKISIQTDVMFYGTSTSIYYLADTSDPNPSDPFATIQYSYREKKFLLNYISIPVMARYAFGPVTVQAGPQIGLLARALVNDTEYKYAIGVDTTASGVPIPKQKLLSQQTKKKDVQDFYKKVDFGLAAGIGGEWGRFQVTARYYMGVMNIANYGSKLTNQSISVSVGWRLSNDY